MPTAFISHVPEDSDIARQIGDALVANGIAVSRSLPAGPSPDGTAAALARSDVVVLVISPRSLGAEDVGDEIAAATKAGKHFLPVLISLSHAEFAHRAPEWQAAIGAASSVAIPSEGVDPVLPRILDGVAALTAPRPAPPRIRKPGRARNLVIAAVAVVALAGVTTVWAVSSGDGASDDDSETTEEPSSTTFAPGPLADAATTPLETSLGDLIVTSALLTPEVCSTTTQECETASGSDRYVLITLADEKGDTIPPFTVHFRQELAASYVEFGDQRATYIDATGEFFGDEYSFDAAYKFLPASAAGGDVRLAWPDSPTLQLDLR